jgi:hypothetical protein
MASSSFTAPPPTTTTTAPPTTASRTLFRPRYTTADRPRGSAALHTAPAESPPAPVVRSAWTASSPAAAVVSSRPTSTATGAAAPPLMSRGMDRKAEALVSKGETKSALALPIASVKSDSGTAPLVLFLLHPSRKQMMDGQTCTFGITATPSKS